MWWGSSVAARISGSGSLAPWLDGVSDSAVVFSGGASAMSLLRRFFWWPTHSGSQHVLQRPAAHPAAAWLPQSEAQRLWPTLAGSRGLNALGASLQSNVRTVTSSENEILRERPSLHERQLSPSAPIAVCST